MSTADRPNLDITGSCDCGDASIAVRGRPISMFQCACLSCQKISGSGHSSVVLFSSNSVSVTGTLKSYERPADLGAVFTRHFCPRCGTTLYAQSSRAPGISIVLVGAFAGNNSWYKPNQLIFARNHAEWDLVDASLPQYDAYRPDQNA